MEKKAIIDFLNEHWDEFITLLSKTTGSTADHRQVEQFPDDISEFIGMLSKLVSAYRMPPTYKQAHEPVQERCTFDRLPLDADMTASYHPDMKGLLGKAQQFRKGDPVSSIDDHSAIIVKNGLFTVQPQQHHNTLDTAFKNLVDSVL